MGELKEFSGIEGSVLKLREMTGEMRGGEPEFYNYHLTHYPAKMFFYKDEKVIYQINKLSDCDWADIIVPGYVKSEPYEKVDKDNLDFGDKPGQERIIDKNVLAVKVEPVKKQERKELENLVRKSAERDFKIKVKYTVKFWEE
ncbi:MAG: hypothetical protein V1886_04470 [archaeon]